MELFHVRPYPRPSPLRKADEEECFTPLGRRVGVWLTTEHPADAEQVLSVTVDESVVLDHEVTAPGDAVRTFVVPYADLASPD
jgi:hypothetical protein